MDVEERLQNIEEKLEKILAYYENENYSDRMVLGRALQLKNKNGEIIFDTTNGIQIGKTDTPIKLFGSAPVTKQAAITPPTLPSGVYSQSDAQSVVDSLNEVITTLRNFGITS